MTKSQLTVRLSSRKTNRHVSPVTSLQKTFRFKSLEIPRVTFIRAVKYVEYLLAHAENDAGKEGTWPSTHLVTLEVRVTDQSVEHTHLVQATLNGSALCLLQRYLLRLEREVEARRDARDNLWLAFNFKWCPVGLADRQVNELPLARFE